MKLSKNTTLVVEVLNLVISGMPSIPEDNVHLFYLVLVLNLVISGMPSIPNIGRSISLKFLVLNLVITGMPSIQARDVLGFPPALGF